MLKNIVKVHNNGLTQWSARNVKNDIAIIQYRHGLLTVEIYECDGFPYAHMNWCMIYTKLVRDRYDDNEMSTAEMRKILIQDKLLDFGKLKNLWYTRAWKWLALSE